MIRNQNKNMITPRSTEPDSHMTLLPVQCKMARAALGWGVRELAAAAKVSTDTVARFERGDELKERTIEALQRVLEAAGIEFTDENGGVGLRLRRC
jgi:transcriptional regulator with XRE-family HTH domain